MFIESLALRLGEFISAGFMFLLLFFIFGKSRLLIKMRNGKEKYIGKAEKIILSIISIVVVIKLFFLSNYYPVQGLAVIIIVILIAWAFIKGVELR